MVLILFSLLVNRFSILLSTVAGIRNEHCGFVYRLMWTIGFYARNKASEKTHLSMPPR